MHYFSKSYTLARELSTVQNDDVKRGMKVLSHNINTQRENNVIYNSLPIFKEFI